MNGVSNRRRILGQAGVLAPLLGLGLLDGAAAEEEPALRNPRKTGELTGTWSVRVTFQDGPPDEMGLFAFTADGLCVLTTTGAGHLGLGSWRTTTQGFEFSFRHFMYDDAQEWIGEVRVRQQGTHSATDSWNASGTGTVFDTDGNQTGMVRSATVGTRY